jgi:hypothetical protein
MVWRNRGLISNTSLVAQLVIMAGSWEKPSPQKINFPDRLKFFQPVPILVTNNVLRQITAGLKKVINCLKIGQN